MEKLRLFIGLKDLSLDGFHLSFISDSEKLFFTTECGFMCNLYLLSNVFRALKGCFQASGADDAEGWCQGAVRGVCFVAVIESHH